MTPQEVLTHPPKVLAQAQRESYFDVGYLVLPGFVDTEWLRRIHAVTAEFVEKSREVSQSNSMFSVEPSSAAARTCSTSSSSAASLSVASLIGGWVFRSLVRAGTQAAALATTHGFGGVIRIARCRGSEGCRDVRAWRRTRHSDGAWVRPCRD